ncbi:MAG: hypothetical protein D6753_16355 [Planctomycetota bacterium]|nr:MAG: hypothetical protein D6753_16355 [Planctomycetota bacterium]
MREATTILVVQRRAWVLGLAICVAFFAMMHLTTGLLLRSHQEPIWTWAHGAFSLERVGNLPALFSILLVLLASLLFWILSRADRLPHGDASVRHRYWRLLALIFVLMALDETCRFHDHLDKLPLLGATKGAALRTIWMFVYAGLGFVLAVILLPFWWRLPSGFRWRYFWCAATYVAGALVLEVVGLWVFEARGSGSRLVLLLQTAEETLEMAAMVGVVGTHLKWLADSNSTLAIEIK